jgi:hypothetical protein
MGNGQPQPQMQRLSPEQIARMQEEDRQIRLEFFPPQVDTNGLERQCVFCKEVLHPLHNRNYDGCVGGYCNKLCRKGHERQLMLGGMGGDEVEMEISKYEDWRPIRHSDVV